MIPLDNFCSPWNIIVPIHGKADDCRHGRSSSVQMKKNEQGIALLPCLFLLLFQYPAIGLIRKR
jgi:hypothetical protein